MGSVTFGDGENEDFWYWNLSEGQSCFSIHTGRVRWNLFSSLVSNEGDSEEDVVVDVECMYEHRISNLWSIDAEILVSIDKKNDESVQKSMILHFNSSSLRFTFGKLVNRRDLHGLEVELYVNIRILSSFGIHVFPILSFDTPRHTDSEIELHFENAKFYANKHLLKSISPIFRKMLSDGKNKIELKGFDWSGIIETLQLLYRQKEIYTSSINTMPILKFATQFEIDFLTLECEDVLISADHISAECKLRIADQYKLAKLQEGILNNITKGAKDTIFGVSIQTLKLVIKLYSTDEDDVEPATKKLCNFSSNPLK